MVGKCKQNFIHHTKIYRIDMNDSHPCDDVIDPRTEIEVGRDPHKNIDELLKIGMYEPSRLRITVFTYGLVKFPSEARRILKRIANANEEAFPETPTVTELFTKFKLSIEDKYSFDALKHHIIAWHYYNTFLNPSTSSFSSVSDLKYKLEQNGLSECISFEELGEKCITSAFDFARVYIPKEEAKERANEFMDLAVLHLSTAKNKLGETEFEYEGQLRHYSHNMTFSYDPWYLPNIILNINAAKILFAYAEVDSARIAYAYKKYTELTDFTAKRSELKMQRVQEYNEMRIEELKNGDMCIKLDVSPDEKVEAAQEASYPEDSLNSAQAATSHLQQ